MPKIAFYTLGCRLNFAESSGLAREFAAKGFEVVDFEQAADVYVVNTCTVTAAAEKKCRQIIHQAHRLNPQAKIAVVGCFSQLRPQEVAGLEGVDWVLGTHDKHLLPDFVSGLRDKAEEDSASVFVPTYSSVGRTRSFFKVQDGCNNFCSYCAIPYARGRSRSDTVVRTLRTAEEIAASGVKEIVLTGVNIGDFGHAHNETLLDLLKALDALEGVERIRIGSVEPDLLSDEIIDLVAGSQKLMPHFHIPLQAGNDEVLKQMRRHYTRNFYAGRVERIRKVLPDAFIACDLIVGFPTETDACFEDAYRFVEGLDLSALHVFSYSSRKEAASSLLKEDYEPARKAERSARMHELSDMKKQRFYARFLRSVQKVLWESDVREGRMFGYTPNYLRVAGAFRPERINTVEEVRLETLFKDEHKDWCLHTSC